MIKVKRAHARPLPEDGRRILVDPWWPEGLKTRYARVDAWMKELGPSYDLARFEFKPENWDSYKAKYIEELLDTDSKKKLLEQLAGEAKNGPITLLYVNDDPEHNNAVIVKEVIENNFQKK